MSADAFIPGLVYEDCNFCLPGCGADAAVMLRWDNGDEAWSIARLWVHPKLREHGLGARLLTAVTSWADKEGHTLILFVEPIGSDGPTESQLIAWYKRHGFERRPGKHRCALIRKPFKTRKRKEPQLSMLG